MILSRVMLYNNIKWWEFMKKIKQIIEKKKTAELSVEDMQAFVDELIKTNGEKEVVSFVEEITKLGVSDEEVYYLASALAASGMHLSTSRELGYCVDSQSVGKFSDPLNIVLMSVLAVYDIKFVKVASNSYSDHGSTFDRLKSIDGLKIPTILDDAYEIANHVGVMLFDAKEVAPAAVKLYNICKKNDRLFEWVVSSTIVANKIATGSSFVIYDVKVGEGSILPKEETEILSSRLLRVSSLARIKAVSVVTDLNWPICASVGYNHEIQEIKDTLSHVKEYPNSRLMTLAKEMTICTLMASGVANSRSAAGEMFADALESGEAYEKMCEILEYYGADIKSFDRNQKFLDTAVSYIVAQEDGYVFDIKLLEINSAIQKMIGEGKKYDKNAGLILMCEEGKNVLKGQKLAKVFFSLENKRYFDEYQNLNNSFVITKQKPTVNNLFYKVIV